MDGIKTRERMIPIDSRRAYALSVWLATAVEQGKASSFEDALNKLSSGELIRVSIKCRPFKDEAEREEYQRHDDLTAAAFGRIKEAFEEVDRQLFLVEAQDERR